MNQTERSHLNTVFLAMIVGSICVLVSLSYLLNISKAGEVSVTTISQVSVTTKPMNSKGMFRILWYNPAGFLKASHRDAFYSGFDKCSHSNCVMTFNRKDADISHAVIFEGHSMPEKLEFTRPNGQVWIFQAHESPFSYNDTGYWWYKNKDYSFNWTMTYDKTNTDIYLPYGEILKHKTEVKKDYEYIARQKSKTLLIVVSHCDVRSKRQEYVNELKKYVDVEVLGACGKKWDCGIHYIHDEKCFQFLNSTYKFYLAFENAFCRQYITEKFYDNFNYDLIMLVRGGLPGEYKQILPKGTFISTEDFKSVKELAKFLKDFRDDTYVNILKRKNQFYSVGFSTLYQRAMCTLCERMNFQSRYAKTVSDIKNWAFGSKPCIDPNEVSDIR